MTTLSDDIDQLRAVGRGALTLLNASILLTIAAVILSTNSGAPAIIANAFSFVTWLVSQVVTPVSGGYNVPLDATFGPAFGGSGSGGGRSAGGVLGSAGTNATGNPFGSTSTGSTSVWNIPGQTGSTGPGPVAMPYDGISTMTIRP
jgi:hypothetical protein